MRRALGALGCLLFAAGCAGPHSTGALWSVQNVEREQALGRLSQADQAARVQALEYGVADGALASERARLGGELSSCPGALEPLSVSPGDRGRDVIRLQAQGDAARLAAVAQLALADWRIRRARATGDARFCDAARSALASPPSPSAANLLDGLPVATVTRDAACSGTAPCFAALARADSGNSNRLQQRGSDGSAIADGGNSQRLVQVGSSDEPSLALSEYALGYVDTVRAAAPLPQYLAFAYGGEITEGGGGQVDAEAAAQMVDRDASTYPQWEPDALYATLRGGHV